MYKLITTKRDKVADHLKASGDPFIMDIRTEKDMKLSRAFKRDYRWMEELINKGLTRVIFKQRTAGVMQLSKIVQKMRDFQRELIIVYDDEAHLKEVKRLINDCIREYDAVQSGEY